MAGMKIVHITTKGRKTGKKRETELFSFEYEDKHVIIASNGGKKTHPEWYLNLRKNPTVELRIGKKAITTTARVTRSPLRDKLWTKLVKLSPHYATFAKKTERVIPVIVLSPNP
jgi:deazaflavin-dependent oxidoreductase (nitroreductase family)